MVVSTRRPLAVAASFAACNFISGGATIRRQLIPSLLDLLQTVDGLPDCDQDTQWLHLQACAILYAYWPSATAQTAKKSHQRDALPDHWALKSQIETLAMRLGLHRSWDQFNACIRRGEPDLSRTYAFRRYTYWLWLYTMAHHFSLTTGTPPTIRPDNCIRSACSLLAQVERPARITRILAEVDLCMLWSAADVQLPGIGEWWCGPPEGLDPSDVVRVLDDADAALEVWSRRWGLHAGSDPTYPGVDANNGADNGAVDFHFRLTSFLLCSFATRIVHTLSQCKESDDQPVPSGTRQLQLDLTLRSVHAAARCCRCLSDWGPLRRDTARYMSNGGFAIVAFCGMYILKAYQGFGFLLPALSEFLDVVEECGILLVDTAMRNARPYGDRVLAHLASIRAGRTVHDSRASCQRMAES